MAWSIRKLVRVTVRTATCVLTVNKRPLKKESKYAISESEMTPIVCTSPT